MLIYCSFLRIWATFVGTFSFFEIFDFEVGHFLPNLEGKPILKYKYLNDASPYMKTNYILRKLLLRALKMCISLKINSTKRGLGVVYRKS